MLAWLRKKITTAPPPQPLPAAAARPAAAPRAQHDAGLILVGREPIVNNHQDIVGYQLLFEGADEGAASPEALLYTLNNLGLERVLGGARAFVKLPETMLDHEVLPLLPARCMVLELPASLEPTPRLVGRCAVLRAAGFRLALGGFRYRPELEPLLGVADYVKLDFLALEETQARAEVHALRGRRLRIVAERVATREAFALGRSLYMNHYQGYFFAQPEVVQAKRLDPHAQRVMRLFNLVSAGADIKLIEQEFKLDVGLSLSLLRYINSPGMGLTEEVRSIRHALLLLGPQRLARWVSLLLMRGAEARPTPGALMKTALLRARLTELLGGARPRVEPDQLFMLGMLSLLDVLCEAPMAEALAGLGLSAELRGALERGEGAYAPYLQLALACEAGARERIETLAAQLGLTPARVGALQLQAMAWVGGMKL